MIKAPAKPAADPTAVVLDQQLRKFQKGLSAGTVSLAMLAMLAAACGIHEHRSCQADWTSSQHHRPGSPT